MTDLQRVPRVVYFFHAGKESLVDIRTAMLTKPAKAIADESKFRPLAPAYLRSMSSGQELDQGICKNFELCDESLCTQEE